MECTNKVTENEYNSKNLCKIKIDSIFQTTIRLMNKNSHLSPFSSSSVAEATIEEKEKTFEMIKIKTQQIQGMHSSVEYS